MAELVVGTLVGRLADFTVEKVREVTGTKKAFGSLGTIREITREIEKLKEELSWIKILMEHANDKWLMDLTEIAYQIEDALDIFYLECSTPLNNRVKVVPRKIYYSRITKHLVSNFRDEVKYIRERISELNENRKKYEIKDFGEDNRAQNTQSDRGVKLDPIGDPEVVGFDEDIHNVVNYLCDGKNGRLTVVSIVGPGGIGKTTLARKVCNSKYVRMEFDTLAWITISQNYDLLDVLRKMAKSFNVESTGLDANDLAEKITKCLNKRRYLIVLDDVWTKELCDELLIKGVLPDNRYGSRVLITTRLAVDVARNADTTYEPYQLKFLNEDESRELFLKNAVPKSHQCAENSIYHLKDLPNKFIRKCQGLPLALIELGRLLSKGPYSYHRWQYLLDTLSWNRTTCNQVIATSFDHLSFASKLCFMYFAAFPEDQMIEAQPLLRMWIAEGLIPHEERRTLEQTTEHFLEDLVQRSMVQASERNPDGSIKYLRIHGIFRDLAIQKAKEMNFLALCFNHNDWKTKHCSKARRVAVHYPDFNESMKQYANPNLRTLLIFENSELDCSNYRLLRVLANMNKEVKLQKFKGSMPLLNYLQLNKEADMAVWQHEEEREFGKWINGMKSLETLELRSTIHCDLTSSIWEIETLRHVQLSHARETETLRHVQLSHAREIATLRHVQLSHARETETRTSTEGPPASANLMNLQTLRGVTYNKTWEKSGLPNLPVLRELDIQLVDSYQCEVIATLLAKLKHLVFLSLSGRDIQIKKFGAAFPFLEYLMYMEIDSGNGCTLELNDNMLPPNLIKLQLGGFEFMSDPMPVLEKLDNLKILEIYGSNELNPLKIYCSSGGFKQLEKLTFRDIKMLVEWNIEIGAMPLLQWVDISGCDNLQVPLNSLEGLTVVNWHKRSTSNVMEANIETITDSSSETEKK